MRLQNQCNTQKMTLDPYKWPFRRQSDRREELSGYRNRISKLLIKYEKCMSKKDILANIKWRIAICFLFWLSFMKQTQITLSFCGIESKNNGLKQEENQIYYFCLLEADSSPKSETINSEKCSPVWAKLRSFSNSKQKLPWKGYSRSG